MTSVEAKLRAATGRTAAEFTEADLSPLRLALKTHGGAERPRFRRGLAALGAAAALLAVLAGSLVLARALRHQAGRSHAPSVEVTSGPLAGIPRYFVELRRDHSRQHVARQAIVIDSVTGRVLATVAVPAPYRDFAAVAAAADDRTFVLGAERWSRTRNLTPFYTKLFVLRIGLRESGRLTVHLSPLGLRIPVNWEGYGLALSPDETKLAFAASPWTNAVRSRIWVYSMRTGAVRSWQDPGQVARAPWDARSLSWSPDDRTLAYFWESGFKVDLLDTTSAGGSLLAHSRTLIVFTQARTPSWDAAELTPDGAKVIASMAVRSGGRIDEFSAATGHLVKSIRPDGLGRPKLYDVLWTNSSGSLMIVALATPTTMKHPEEPVVLLRGTKLTPMPGVQVYLSEDVAW
jgi:hypothetical protein